MDETWADRFVDALKNPMSPNCGECRGNGSIPFLADGQWTDRVCEECGGTGETRPEPADHPRMF